MEYYYEKFARWVPLAINGDGRCGGVRMDNLTKHVENLEKDVNQIKRDLAVLTERANSFAISVDLQRIRTQQVALRSELLEKLNQLEKNTETRFDKIDGEFIKIDGKFDKIDEKFDKIDEEFIRIDGKFAKIDEEFSKVDKRFDRMEDKFDSLNNRILWTLMVPALVAVLAWFVKTAILKI
ncbi:hypothetical protein [Mixta mediterraneensis]|uniref:hypothetical protein n=1 Tax=Mixta mediterraneensis TaxID=2758443 RepID=UPI00187565BD|nr:hypothetical protein [Mixta mediterraneensis]MBE5252510.1 hypothetical protein [Mixta mediterraneensis]